MQLSYEEIQDRLAESGFSREVTAGDLVRTGPNYHPHFRVLAIDSGTAWLRNIDTGVDGLVPLERCERLAG